MNEAKKVKTIGPGADTEVQHAGLRIQGKLTEGREDGLIHEGF